MDLVIPKEAQMCPGQYRVCAHRLLLVLSTVFQPLPAFSEQPTQEALPPDVRPQIEALSSGDTGQVLAAVDKLGEMGPRASAAIPFLIPLLKDRGLETLNVDGKTISGFELTSKAAAGALARMGKPAIRPLESSLSAREAEDDATYWASVALVRMGDATATKVLLTKLATPGFPRRRQIARALGRSDDAQTTTAGASGCCEIQIPRCAPRPSKDWKARRAPRSPTHSYPV